MRSEELQSGYQPEGLWRDFTVLDWPTLLPLMTESTALVGNPGMYQPRMDYYDLWRWTSFYDNQPLLKTLEKHVDFDRLRPGTDAMSSATDAIQPDRSGFIAAGRRRIYWEYFGTGKREVVCLLNGLAMSTKSWYRFLPYLLDEYDVLLHDYLGQGKSSCEDEAYFIPSFCDHLGCILDGLRIPGIHLLGLSYGGFIALDFARLYQERLLTLTLSGILLSHEELFKRYQDLSLRFYRSGAMGFELYTYYMYEKIFGESFLRRAEPHVEKMRHNFHNHYKDRVHCLIRLTEAQNPFFAGLDHNLSGYQAIRTPTLILNGAEDRVILPQVQQKIGEILPNAHFELIDYAGHVVYLERPETFFERLKWFTRARNYRGCSPG